MIKMERVLRHVKSIIKNNSRLAKPEILNFLSILSKNQAPSDHVRPRIARLAGIRQFFIPAIAAALVDELPGCGEIVLGGRTGNHRDGGPTDISFLHHFPQVPDAKPRPKQPGAVEVDVGHVQPQGSAFGDFLQKQRLFC